MTSAAAAVRLLAVDDNSEFADLVVRVAEKCGYEARGASDPEKLSALVASWKPEVLTLDLCMPGADGIDLLAVQGFTGLLVIISGQDNSVREAEGRRAKARGLKLVDNLQKPVHISALRQLLNRLRQTEPAQP